MDVITRRFEPFREKELFLLKEVLSEKWAVMEKKVENLGKEVFEEILETELALTRLQTKNLSDSLPKEIKNQNRSLLHRLNTLSQSLKRKQTMGKGPPNFEVRNEDDSSESLKSSIIEVDEDEHDSRNDTKEMGDSTDREESSSRAGSSRQSGRNSPKKQLTGDLPKVKPLSK